MRAQLSVQRVVTATAVSFFNAFRQFGRRKSRVALRLALGGLAVLSLIGGAVAPIIGGALAPLVGAATAAAATGLSCPGGSFNLCIPAQGANEGVTGTSGSTVVAGYDFAVPGSDTTVVKVIGAYEQLTISCANGATPTVSSINVPMPDATYTAPFQQSQGWVPTGDQSSKLSYEGSFTLGNYCNGGTIRVGQPGQMLFAAQVQSNGTSSLSFRSHYNDGSYSKSGSWSATVSVKPTPIPTVQTIAGHIYLCNSGTQTTTEVAGGTLGATGPQTVSTQPNPLGPVSVAAGTYTMTEANPAGFQLAGACGTLSPTQSVTVPSGGAGVGIFYVTPITQTIAGHIYLCNNGTQTTTEVAGGTLGATGPQTVPTQPNPLGPVSVAAGTYTMTETNPAGFQLAGACGTLSPTQSVTVPSGGDGVGIFYVTPTTTCPSGTGFRQASSADKSNVRSISTTLSSTPTGGDLLIAEVQEAEGTAMTTSVTDGNLSFTLQKTVTGPSPDNTQVTIWTLLIPCGATPGTTITATASNNSDMGIAVMEYAGLSGAIDGFGSASGFATAAATTVTSGAGAAANAGDLVLGFEGDSGWSVHLAADTADGYTSRVNVQNNQVAEFLVEDQVAGSPGTYNAKTTITYTPATAGELQNFGLPGVPYVMGTIAFAPTASPSTDTIFGAATPAMTDSGDSNSVVLGVEFQSSVPGTVTGIRFYKASTNTGTHVGSLWSASGQLLATATFTNETASGWQTVTFGSPVVISTNTTYIASYFAPNGHYSDTSEGLASAVTSGPLTALANSSATPGNGVFAYTATPAAFPNQTFNATNYWVDVAFTPSP
jgi:hypothetical protein